MSDRRGNTADTPEDRLVEALLDLLDLKGVPSAWIGMPELQQELDKDDACDDMPAALIGAVLKTIGVTKVKRKTEKRGPKEEKIRYYWIERRHLMAYAPWREELPKGTDGDRAETDHGTHKTFLPPENVEKGPGGPAGPTSAMVEPGNV